MLRRLIVLTLSAVLVAGACGSSGPSATATIAPPPTPSAEAAPTSPYASASAPTQPLVFPARTAFIQLFEWTWPDIALECEQWLGPMGFAAVQVSPPQEHALIDDGTNHFPWWQRYQPVSYKLESRSGTRAEFADMVRRCSAVGVDIYADVVLNHMTAGDGVGSAGTTYVKYEYGALYGPEDFHAHPNPGHPGVLCARSIADYREPTEVRTCELLG